MWHNLQSHKIIMKIQMETHHIKTVCTHQEALANLSITTKNLQSITSFYSIFIISNSICFDLTTMSDFYGQSAKKTFISHLWTELYEHLREPLFVGVNFCLNPKKQGSSPPLDYNKAHRSADACSLGRNHICIDTKTLQLQ